MAVAVYPLIVVLLTLALLLLIATNKAYQYTFGVMLSWLAAEIRKLPGSGLPLIGGGLHALAGMFDAVNNFILRKIGEGITELENAVLFVWGNMISTIQELGKLLAEIPHETGRALHILTRSTIGRIVTGIIGGLPGLVYVLRHQLAALYKAGAHVAGLSAREVRSLISQATAVALPGFKRIEREIAAERRRLSRLEKGAIIGTAVGVVAFALSKLGLGHLSKSQCRRNTKAICGMNPSALDTLVSDALLIVGTVSLVEFAKGMQGVVSEIEQPIRTFWRAA